MKQTIKTGLCFGVSSGTITTLGLMVGLSSGTHSKTVVIGGLLIIAIADAMSDALGIHISEEARNKDAHKDNWEATISTFFSKFIFTMTYIIPVLLFNLTIAIFVSIIYGFILLGVTSYFIGREQKIKTWKVIVEHLSIALAVVIITHYVGSWINVAFK